MESTLRKLFMLWADFEFGGEQLKPMLMFISVEACAIYFIFQAMGAPPFLAKCGVVAFPVLCWLLVNLSRRGHKPTVLSLSASGSDSPITKN
jgi:hypothetical protein